VSDRHDADRGVRGGSLAPRGCGRYLPARWGRHAHGEHDKRCRRADRLQLRVGQSDRGGGGDDRNSVGPRNVHPARDHGHLQPGGGDQQRKILRRFGAATDHAADDASYHAADDASYHTSDHASYHASYHAADPASYHTSDHASYHTSDHAADPASYHATDHTSDPASYHAADPASYHAEHAYR
jgi:hypothetical protein